MIYNGKEYEIHVGTRGGSYIIVNGKKKYLKGSTTKKIAKDTPKLKHYICYYRIRENGEVVDDFKEWYDAYSREEAEREFRDRYPDTERYEISFVQECKE